MKQQLISSHCRAVEVLSCAAGLNHDVVYNVLYNISTKHYTITVTKYIKSGHIT